MCSRTAGGYPGGGRHAPYENYRAWRNFVRGVAEAARGKGDAIWDVWNEPDHAQFWAGTPEQFYETYRIAENVLREVLGPDVVVGGPSTMAWRRDWVSGLLEYCLRWRCQVNVVSWHELEGASIPALRDHVADIHRTMLDNPRYATLGLREIHVNEAVGERDQYRPGEVLGTMYYLERGGASASARACWDDDAGDSNCYNDSLAGLVVPGTDEPRSAWWATRAYAEGVGTRVATRSSDPQLIAIPSARGPHERTAQVLVAHLQKRPGGRRQRADVRVTLRSLGAMRWLRGRHWLRVAITRFPNTGEAPLAKAPRLPSLRVRIEDGVAVVNLLGLPVHEAYRLTLS